MQTYTHKYPSDITREQYELIREILEGSKKKTKPRKIDMYSVFCAVLYIVKGGVQWRMIPANFPKMGIVRYYYDVWSVEREDGTTVLSEVLKKISDNNTKRRLAPR